MSFGNIEQTKFDQDLYPQPQKPRGWWSRNWLWFVPTLLLVMMVMCCGCPVAIFFGVVGVLKNTEPYQKTMEKIESDPQLQEAFGVPILDDSWVPAGEVTVKNGAGNAELRWDLKGPKGKGKAYVKARLMDGKWEIVMIEVTLPDGKKILLHEEGGGNEAPPFKPQATGEAEKTQESTPEPDLNPTIPMPEETEPKK